MEHAMLRCIFVVIFSSCFYICNSELTYEYDAVSLTWREAVVHCEDKDMALATVDDVTAQNNILHYLTAAHNGVTSDMWIYGHVTHPIETRLTGDECMMIYYNPIVGDEVEFTTSWAPCHDNNQFICYDDTVDPPKYRYHGYGDAQTGWSEALAVCEQTYGRIGDADEFDESLVDRDNVTTIPHWLIFSTWWWANDTKITGYSNWADSEPSQGNQTCVTLNSDTGKWSDERCDERLPVLCQYHVETTAAPVASSPQGDVDMTTAALDVDLPSTREPADAATTATTMSTTSSTTPRPPRSTSKRQPDERAEQQTAEESDDSNTALHVGLGVMGFIILLALVFIAVFNCYSSMLSKRHDREDALQKSKVFLSNNYPYGKKPSPLSSQVQFNQRISNVNQSTPRDPSSSNESPRGTNNLYLSQPGTRSAATPALTPPLAPPAPVTTAPVAPPEATLVFVSGHIDQTATGTMDNVDKTSETGGSEADCVIEDDTDKTTISMTGSDDNAVVEAAHSEEGQNREDDTREDDTREDDTRGDDTRGDDTREDDTSGGDTSGDESARRDTESSVEESSVFGSDNSTTQLV